MAQERYLHDAYGRRDVLSGAWVHADDETFGTDASGVGFDFGHQGGRYDLHSGLMLFRHRPLSPELMRWPTPDPLGFVDGGSLYQYVASSPIRFNDPSGLRIADEDRPPGSGISVQGLSYNGSLGSLSDLDYARILLTALKHDRAAQKLAEAGNATEAARHRALAPQTPEELADATRALQLLLESTDDPATVAYINSNGTVDGFGALTTLYNQEQLAHAVSVLLVRESCRVSGATRVPTNAAREISSVGDVLSNPKVLRGKTPAQVETTIGKTPGWKVESLGKGSRAGEGWVLREYTPQGNPTGRMIRWHPGGGHHGPEPYWRVTSGEGGKSDIIR